jgi:DNA primase
MEDAGNDPVKRAALIGDIVRSIALIPNQMIRTEYVKQCSTLLQVEEALLYFEINKLKTNEANKPRPERGGSPAEQSRFEAEERNLLQILIRYGTSDMQDPILRKQHPEPVLVADYILDEINRDGLEMDNPVHREILKEYELHWQDEQFNAEKYFLYHRDENIARLSVELLTEKYTLSKIHSKMKKVDTDAERLHDIVPRLVYEYKNALILDYIREGLMRLKQASETHDDELASQIMLELKQLDELKRELAQNLGARIITRF